MELKDRIQTRMDEKKWKLADLARESGVAKGYLWEILAGKATRPSAVSLYSIAEALGTSVGDLLGKVRTGEATVNRDIPKELQEFATQNQLPQEDVDMLASIRFRNAQPKDVDSWRYLWESIQRSVRP